MELPGILRIALGDKTEQATDDGTYAHASGNALVVDLLNLIPNSVVTLTLGHAEATAQTPQANADLAITKNATSNGLQLTFTVTATNQGPNTAQNAWVNDTITCEGLTYQYISSNATQGSYDPNTGTWTIGNLEPGQSATLNITVKVSGPGTITNTAEIRSDTPDTNLMNNRAAVSVAIILVPPAADLAISKVANQTTVNYLDTVKFTITAKNLGPDDSTGVTVTDLLPAGLEYVSSTTTQGTYASGVWTIGELANGATATLEIIAKVVASNTTLTNTANITGNEYDQNTTNNMANATVSVPPAEMPEQPTKVGVAIQGVMIKVPMKPTGMPIVPLIFGMLSVFAGVAVSKRNNL